MNTYRRMHQFCEGLEELTFEDITKEWLVAYDTYLSETSPSRNARNVHFRNIRAVFNEALDDGITKAYPFRRFKIRPVATVKRSFSVEQLRTLFNTPTNAHTEQALDLFKLIFLLIGINVIDLCMLREITNGRVEFYRSKTNRLYSIKVEPEAMTIIDKYRGTEYLLDILEKHASHRSFTTMLNSRLKDIGIIASDPSSKPVFPKLTTYWARHGWASIAKSKNIPLSVISEGMGHDSEETTRINLASLDTSVVDRANSLILKDL